MWHSCFDCITYWSAPVETRIYVLICMTEAADGSCSKDICFICEQSFHATITTAYHIPCQRPTKLRYILVSEFLFLVTLEKWLKEADLFSLQLRLFVWIRLENLLNKVVIACGSGIGTCGVTFSASFPVFLIIKMGTYFNLWGTFQSRNHALNGCVSMV